MTGTAVFNARINKARMNFCFLQSLRHARSLSSPNCQQRESHCVTPRCAKTPAIISLHWEAEQQTQAACVLLSGGDAAFTCFLGCDGQEQQGGGHVSVRSCP